MKKMFVNQVVGRVRQLFGLSVCISLNAVALSLGAQEISFNNGTVTVMPSEPVGYEAVTADAKPLNLSEVVAQIQYPKACSNTGIQGKVYVRILVNTEGKPIKHTVLKSDNEALTEATLKVIYNLVFEPGKLDGKAVNSWVTIPFQYKIIGSASTSAIHMLP
ncbi:MAG: energy transducer TonB [Cytophagales bacterium]|nr:energy transducer TonB [Cytophagales bacterium]MDW8385118.1 energy transducer TonB [Flammeovirgaceae bacterium]